MISLFAVLVLVFSFDWAKSCKIVKYNFKQYGVKKYGYGTKKGCFMPSWDQTIKAESTDQDTDGLPDLKECKDIKAGAEFDNIYGFKTVLSDEEEAKDECEKYTTCQWYKKKCIAASCPSISYFANCPTSKGWTWEDGKCKKPSDCNVEYAGDSSVYEKVSTWYDRANDAYCKNLTSYYKVDYTGSGPSYIPFSSDDAKECTYKCEHREYYHSLVGPYQYTVDGRKYCHNQLGCLYANNGSNCSVWSIWAFILVLVLLILLVVVIIAVIVIIILKCRGSASTKVSPESAAVEAQPKSAEAVGAAPATQPAQAAPQAPPAQSAHTGPYVVIKLGKQELSTKKADSSVWGESIQFNGLGPEDDDVDFELHSDGGALLGSAHARIMEYVNTKKRASVSLKNDGADIGVLEVDIEIQVQEEPLKITGLFFVDRYTKA